MGLTIRPKFNVNDIRSAVERRLEKVENAILFRLQLIGEKFVTNARTNANFTDRTGNLRSSIGYVISKNGETVSENFKNAGTGPDGKTGVGKSKEIAAKVAGFFPKGFALVVVAGMEYAAAVESKNYDVITSSSLIAEDELRKAIEGLNEKIPKMQ
jgi:hypothetical protein